MRRYAICGDIHWSTYSSIIRKRGRKYSQRLEHLIKSVNWFEKLAKDNKCDEEIFLGDTFDRPDLSAEELTALQEIKWNKLPKKFLVGNHESNINTLEFSSTKFFESINADVIDKPVMLEITDKVNFYLFPYITTDKVIPLSTYFKDDIKKKIVFAHQEIAGIQYGKFLSQSGFNIDEIMNSCELFFDGHLHNEANFGDKLILVGILSGQNFNEDALKFRHLAYILTVNDDGSCSYEYFENPEAFNFYKLRFETENDFSKLDNLKNNAILSAVCEEKLSKELSKQIRKNKKILESRITIFYNYNSEDGDYQSSILVDDYVRQFVLLAKEKLENSSVLDNELARLGGD